MGAPLGKDFEAPISPWANQDYSPASKVSGGRLFDQVSEFYAWYMSWDISPIEHAQTFEYLSRIMRIAQVCKDGGHFLSESEEQKALKSLSALREELYDGFCRQQEIPQNLLKIIQVLTEANPKARLVAHTNQLEYMLCIHSADPQQQARYQLLLDQILSKVNPSLLDTHAHAVSQGLTRIIENPKGVPDVHEAIVQATKHWL